MQVSEMQLKLFVKGFYIFVIILFQAWIIWKQSEENKNLKGAKYG